MYNKTQYMYVTDTLLIREMYLLKKLALIDDV